MKRHMVAVAGFATVILASAPVVFAQGTSSGESTAAAAAAGDVAASPSSGATGTNTGSAGTGASTTGTSSSALTSTASSDSSGITTDDCPSCPHQNAGEAVAEILNDSPLPGTPTAGNPVCDMSIDIFCVSTNDPDEGSGNPLTPVTKLLPSQGIVAIGAKNPEDLDVPESDPAAVIPVFPFYVFYDGYPYDMSPLGGYLGINGFDSNYALLGLVASTDPRDNFNRLGGNVPLIGNVFASLALMADQTQNQDGFTQLLPGLNSQGTGSSPECSGTDALCISTHDPDAGTGNPLADVTKILPTQGILVLGPGDINEISTDEAALNPGALYLFFDGEPYNLDPLGGYLGLNGNDFDIAVLGLVASLKNTDNFQREGGNLPILGYPSYPLTSYVSPVFIHLANP